MSKKKTILKEAAKLFAEKGFNETPTSEIAEASGAAHGTIFYHFPTKMDIIKEIYNSLVEEYWDRQNRAVGDEENGLTNLTAIIHTTFSFAEEHRAENTVLHRDLPAHIHSEKELIKDISAHNVRIIEMLKKAINKGMQDGSIRKDIDDEHYASLIRAMFIGVIKMKYTKAMMQNIPTSTISEFCVNALLPRGDM